MSGRYRSRRRSRSYSRDRSRSRSRSNDRGGSGGGRISNRRPPNIEGMVSLKVDNLSYHISGEELLPIFEKFGEVGDIYIPRDRYTKDSRGFAFVRFYHRRDAEDAMDKMDGHLLEGREMRVQTARYGRPTEPPRVRYGRAFVPRGRSRSPSFSPKRYNRRSHTPDRKRRSYSRGSSRSRSRERRRSRSPEQRRSLSPEEKGSRSPEQARSRSPEQRSCSPEPRRSRSPDSRSP